VHWIRNILREVLGLFVDDGRFAVAILVWLGVVRLVLSRLVLSHLAFMRNKMGIILFVGLGIILIENTIRYSRGKELSTGE
jgi:hypothetical protein